MKSLLKSGLVLLLWQAVAIQAGTIVTQISTGYSHSLFLKSDSSLWDMGRNDSGELGDGTFNDHFRPEQIVSNGVVAIAAGGNHSLFLKSDHSLWGMGSGAIGHGTLDSTNRPEQIVSSGVIAIAAGYNHSLFLKSDGSLWSMGYNGEGQLGDGTFNSANVPERIVSAGVVAIAGGLDHSLFIKSGGSLWGMGDNSFGQLGSSCLPTTNIPTPPNWCSTNRPVQIVPNDVVTIACGLEHSLFIKSDGSLWGMGDDGFGELGDGTNLFYPLNGPIQIISNGVVAVAAGGWHSIFLKSDGSIWCMGENQCGQLGDGTLDATNRPVQVISGGGIAIAAGFSYSLFLKSDGTLWGMGCSEYGQLGDGFTNSYSSVPVRIVPSPPQVLTSSIASKTNLQFKATCQFGGTFYLRTSTNLTQPLNQWTPVWTNSVTSRSNNNFTATLTNAVNPSAGPQFYILQSQ